MLKGNFKKIIGIYLTISFAFVLALPVYAGSATSGCVSNVEEEYYKFDEQTGHLTIGKAKEEISMIIYLSIPKDKIKSVTIKEGVTKIDGGTFAGCKSLTSVNIPNSVTEIGSGTFSGCSGLTSITIGNGVKKIYWRAFEGCKRLTSITIPDSVTLICEHAFSGCKRLTSINVDEGNKYYRSIDGVLFSKHMRRLIRYPAGRKVTNYIFPDSVTEMDSSAFHGCTSLKEVTIPKGINICRSTFDSCTTVHRK